MAAIQARRGAPGRTVTLLESARAPGAKILVSGGGRCNVTHDEVDELSFAGASPRAVRNVLRRFGVAETVAFFAGLGVALKREETGKLFPVTDRARTVLDALVGEARRLGAAPRHPCRVERIERRQQEGGFVLSGAWGEMRAEQVILATGGRSLPKSGSDGHGYELARALGHSITPRVFPALVPLLLPEGHRLRALTGVSADVALRVVPSSGARQASMEGSLLCTHFGLSGPVVLDISRHLIEARFDDPAARLICCWWPGEPEDAFAARLRSLGRRGCGALLRERLAERLARGLCAAAGVDPAEPAARLPAAALDRLAAEVSRMELPVAGDRGFTHAEVTAGGVPLDEVDPGTMRSRRCPGLLLCGEILSVDGRVGGYNFQWAWTTGWLAGRAAFARDLA